MVYHQALLHIPGTKYSNLRTISALVSSEALLVAGRWLPAPCGHVVSPLRRRTPYVGGSLP